MTKSFFFYDLETSGLSPRDDRVMQFAGQRTDFDLQPIGEPINVLVKLNDDVLPSPDAMMITGITPQQTQADGLTESELAKFLSEEVFTPDTTVVGYNNIRFDDEFIRHLFWRNFFDPYEWSWKDGRSRWDLLDVVRMTRALRPEGIAWPTDKDGKATNRLELLAKSNKIIHTNAHDALSDVEALISLTNLIKTKQPQLFDYLLEMRNKNNIKKLVNLDDKKPFVYSSGRLDAEFEKTTVAFPLTAGKNGNTVVFDLRIDPTPFLGMDLKALEKKLNASWEERKKEDFVKLPVKELQYNRAPAVAPLGVLESGDGWKKIKLNLALIEKHKDILLAAPHFAENIRSIFESRPEFKKSTDPEAQLYDGFVGDRDRLRIETVRNSSKRELADFHPDFVDERLSPLLLHYKARNFPSALSEDETKLWQEWRSGRIQKQLPSFMASLQRLASKEQSEDKQFLLQEARLWAESLVDLE